MVAAILMAVLGSSVPAGYCLGVLNTPQEIIRAWIQVVVADRYGVDLTAGAEVSTWATVVTLYVVGAILGCQCGPKLADKCGRRGGLLVNHIMFVCTGVVLLSCRAAGSIEMLLAGRLTSGLSSGIATSLVPLYLSEVAPPALKGVMGITFPMGMCIGVLTSQVMGMESILGTSEEWNYLLGCFIIFVAIAILLHPVVPESPAYCYIIAQDEVRGHKELQRIYGKESKNVEVEGNALKVLAELSNASKNEGSNWSFFTMIKDRNYRLPLLIPIILNIGQQFSGINAVFFYSTLIFRSAGLDLMQSQGASIGAGVINCIMSITAAPLIKYCRRRSLLMISIVLCIVCQILLMASLKLIPMSVYASYTAIAALMSYVLFYGMGLGPVPYMVATELFPAGPRSIGISAGGTSNWLSNLVVGLSFPLIQEYVGEYSFYVFIISSLVLLLYVYRFLPETLEQEESPSSPGSLEIVIESNQEQSTKSCETDKFV